ncbi:MAG: DUF2207 domain-containing protein [Microgenomates group bacterium]|jgi:uncharacterized membrane protein
MKNILKSFLFLFLFVFWGAIYSGVQAEEITSFDTEIIAHQDGTMDITETIVYDFGDVYLHGIYRDIPLVSSVGNLYRVIEVDFKNILRDGKEENYSLQSDSKTASVKIGKADVTITGPHTYTISYLVRNGIGSNYEDHDEIYWNITGNNWQIPILKASASLSTDFGVDFNKDTCFTGPEGSTNKDCLLNQKNLIVSTKELSAYEGLTGVWGFPKDTFPPSVLQKESPEKTDTEISLWLILGIFAVPIFFNLILAPGLLIWYFKNKRKARFGAPSVNFDFPIDDKGKRVAPAEAGSIDAYFVDQNDVIATIFDLAIRKYIKIEQIKQEKVLGMFGGGDDFLMIKLNNYNEGTTAFEWGLLQSFFRKEDKIKISSLKKDFYLTFQSFEKDVFDSLIERGFYTKNPKTQKALFLTGAIFSMFFGGVLLFGVLLLFFFKLNGRTAKGDEIDFKIDGLKIFLKNMSREHTWYAKNLITVEKYIPYAIALGYIKEFMDQLKVIYPNYHPTWYSGNIAFYSAIDSMNSSMSSTFTTHAPSSSSGFSSGGSSGGGGGGGGGGSW